MIRSNTYEARRRQHSASTAVAAAALALALSACQGGGPDDSGDDTDGQAGDQAEVQDAMLEYAECMRENGVPMEDPEPGGRGLLVNGAEVDQQALEAAEEECGHLIEDAIPEDAVGEMPAEQKEAMLAQAECMRERGWDVPDPQFEGNGVRMTLPEGIDAEDPSFQADHEVCAEEAGLEMPRMEGP